MNIRNFTVGTALLIIFIFATNTAYAKKGPKTHQLGPTGLIGIISKTTAKITEIAKGSPADGKIKKGDQIIGVGGSKFKTDVRHEMADAIDAAETKAGGGKLKLILKGGKEVVLQLRVLGSYGPDAPYDSSKVDTIVTMAAEKLIKGKLESVAKTELLGLLATGEQKYINFVKNYVHDTLNSKKYNEFNPDPEFMEKLLEGTGEAGYVCWSYGYTLIFLCEYYLMTQDEAVLPGIKTYAVAIARGQGPVGTYGHRFATAKLNGQIRGYGAMNQPSLSCILGMFLAQKCGVDDPRLKKGADISYRHYAAAIGKCAFNYGTIGNTAAFNNNGTSGSAAVCMSVKGNKEGAKFFAILSAASYGSIETGHTGHFFNVMWTPLGANIGGPDLTKQFFKKTRWLQTLYRTWDGGFTFDGGSYKRCNSTGSHLLFYCTPRRKLYITGKDSKESWLTPAEAEEAIGLADIDYANLPSDKLIKLAMEHPIPQVRRKAGGALSKKLGELQSQLLGYLDKGNDNQRGMVASLCGWWIPDEEKLPFLDGIGALLRDDNASFEARRKAAESISQFKDKEKTRKYYMDIIRLMAKNKSNAKSLVRCAVNLGGPKPFGDGLVKDKNILYKAILPILDDKDQKTRGAAMKLIADIPLEDFHIVADKIIWSLENKDGSSSNHNPAHVYEPAITIMSHLNIREGLEYAQGILKQPGGKGSFKIRAFLNCLAMYGSAAKPFVEENGRFEEWSKNRKLARQWRNMIKAVEEDKAPRKLISLEEAIKK